MPPDEGESPAGLLAARRAAARSGPGNARRSSGASAPRGSPLYLRLAFEEARLWPSTLEDVRIGADEPVSIIGRPLRPARNRARHRAGGPRARLPRLRLRAAGPLRGRAPRCARGRRGDVGGVHRRRRMGDAGAAAAGRRVVAAVLRPGAVPESAGLRRGIAAVLLPQGACRRGTEALRRRTDSAAARRARGRDERLARGKDAGAREWNGSAHALAELPYHLTRAERWDDVFATLTDFTYLEEKAKRVAVVTAPAPRARTSASTTACWR